jgi:hypothetical protein
MVVIVYTPRLSTEGLHFAQVVYVHELGPCHHGMARPQVADGGTASDMEGSCE